MVEQVPSKELITAPENPTLDELIAFYGEDNFRSGVTVRVPYRATRRALDEFARLRRAVRKIGNANYSPAELKHIVAAVLEGFEVSSAHEPPDAPTVSKAIDDYGPWTLPQLAFLVENVANCLDHGTSASACAAELRGIAKHMRAPIPPRRVDCTCNDFPGSDQFCTAHSTANR